MIWTNNTFTLTNKSTRSCCFALLLGPPPPNNIWSIHPLHTNSIVTIYPNNSLITENQQLRFNRHKRYYDVTTTSCTLENFAKFWVFNKIEFGKSQKPKISIYNFDSFQVKTKKKKRSSLPESWKSRTYYHHGRNFRRNIIIFQFLIILLQLK